MVSSNDNGGPILLDTLDADGGPLALAPRNDKGEPIISDGGSSAYYVFPDGASELNDLIEHRQMSFARGNIFKALYRLGEKAGVDVEYDLNKMELFLARLRKMHREGKSI
jgi:hypothetical protein